MMDKARSQYRELLEEDFLCAMKEIGTYVDVTSRDLVDLYHLACKYSDIRHTEAVFVRDVMTRDVVTVSLGSSLAEAARILLVRNLKSLPVVDEGEHVVGIITEADIMEQIGMPCYHPLCTLWHRLHRLFSHARHIHGLTGRVDEAMQAAPITASEEQTLHDAIETMRRRHVKSLVVTDVAGSVRGILTRSNIVRAFLRAMEMYDSDTGVPEGSDFC